MGKTSTKKEVPVDSESDGSDADVKAPVSKRTRALSNASANGDKKKSSGKKVVDSSDDSDDERPKKAAANPESDGEDSEPQGRSRKASKVSAAKKNDSDSDAGDAPVEDSGKFELFVKGLSFDTTSDTLRDTFGKYGEVTKVNLLGE